MKSKEIAKSKSIRNAEYYDLIDVFDELYAQSMAGNKFDNLMEYITSDENIKLAYRNIKRNRGSTTPGTDNLTIKNIEALDIDTFISKVIKKFNWYKSRKVKRVDIPKPNGGIRPLGIPSIWDRIIQQCILQVLEPICEAKFHYRSNGFRPNRSAENAIAQCYKFIQQMNLHYVVDIDIKGFFDNVNHSKLIRQMWTLGIKDKKLICIIKEMLKAPIVMPNGDEIYPTKGTPQGGILSPLLSNIVLNELDWWVASQWEEFPTKHTYHEHIPNSGKAAHDNKYRAMRNTNLKEMHMVRYADDFKIFCKTKADAEKTFIAVEQWVKDRLGLEISKEKSKIVNLEKHYSEFLGFKMKAVKKGQKFVVQSHISDKALKREGEKLTEQIKVIQSRLGTNRSHEATTLYNSMVMGIHEYYNIATHINPDFHLLAFRVHKMFKNRIRKELKRECNGKISNKSVLAKYAKSKQIRYINGMPILPIGYVQHKNPMFKKVSINKYTVSGREEIHKMLGCVDKSLLNYIMTHPVKHRSIEYNDNRVSLYVAQKGMCAVTGQELNISNMECHHKIPKHLGGNDKYQNLILITFEVHKLIHVTSEISIKKYLDLVKPTQNALTKINNLREQSGNQIINAM